MSSFKEAFGDLLQGTVNAGLKVPFSKKKLDYYGVKPKKLCIEAWSLTSYTLLSLLAKKPELVNYL